MKLQHRVLIVANGTAMTAFGLATIYVGVCFVLLGGETLLISGMRDRG